MKKNIDAPTASDDNHKCYVLGCKFYDTSKFNKAITAFKEALEYWPEDHAAWWALGNCYDELNKPKRAKQCFRKALSHSTEKDRGAILFNLGNSLYDQGLTTEAIGAYEKIAAGNSIWRSAQRNIALARKNGQKG